jgi:HAD superfamily hydrolase (TIGR01509 family)
VLKAIAFDLWETLITNTAEISVAHRRMRLTRLEEVLTSHGHAAEAVQIERAYRACWTRCHELYWSKDRDIPCRRQIELFLEDLGVDASRLDDKTLDDLERVYATVAVDMLPAMVPGAAEVIAAVRRRGLRTGLISNTGRTPGYALREILTRLDLAPMLEVMVFSNEHGECKPQPSIFEQLRTALDVRYDEILFIGDNLHVDVYGAKRCGMRAVHFMPPARGTAVAPVVEVDVEVVADATVTRLHDLLAIIEEIRD